MNAILCITTRPTLVLAKPPVYLISEIRTYGENSIIVRICIKIRHCKFGYDQSGIAEKLLLIDLSGTYDIITRVKRTLDYLG